MMINMLTEAISKNGLTHSIMSYITYVVHHMTPGQDKKKLSMALTILHFYNVYTSLHKELDNSVYDQYPLFVFSIYSGLTFALAFVIQHVMTDGMNKKSKMELIENLNNLMYQTLDAYPFLSAQKETVISSDNVPPPPPTNTPLESPLIIPELEEFNLDDNTDLSSSNPTTPRNVELVNTQCSSVTIEPKTVETKEDLEEKAQEVVDNSCVLI